MLAYLLLTLVAMRLSHIGTAWRPWLDGPSAVGALARLHPRDWVISYRFWVLLWLETLSVSSLPLQALIFEITETVLMNHLALACEVIDALREAGCRVALDDFGNGLSSFSYLRNFVVDLIKIDGGLIRHVNDNALDQVIVDAINQIAQRLDALTVAEFIEVGARAERLVRMGVDYGQGYYMHRPMPLERLWLE